MKAGGLQYLKGHVRGLYIIVTKATLPTAEYQS